MNREITLGLLRHVLSVASASLAAKGYLGDETGEAVAGAVMVLANVAWFLFDRARATKATEAKVEAKVEAAAKAAVDTTMERVARTVGHDLAAVIARQVAR